MTVAESMKTTGPERHDAMSRSGAWLALGAAVLAAPAAALSLDECARSVAVHGEEYGHTDLTGGLVLWGYRWTNEGTAEDMNLADCRAGEMLSARLMSRGMTEPIPYDRRERAATAMMALLDGSMSFINLDRVANAMGDIRVPVERGALADEPCACAALYPGARDDLAPYGGAQ